MSTFLNRPGRHLAVGFPPDLAAVREASRQVRLFLEQQGVAEDETAGWELVCAEAGNNAVQHVRPEAVDEQVEFRVAVAPDRVDLEIVDHTPGFEIELSPELPEDPLSEHGRGLFLMHSLVDGLEYLRGREENRLVAWRRRSVPEVARSASGQSEEAAALEATLQTMTEELAGCYESLSAIFRFTADLNRGGQDAEFTQRWLGELAQVSGADWYVLRLAEAPESPLKVAASSRSEHALQSLQILPDAMSYAEVRAAAGRQDIWFDGGTPVAPGDPLEAFGRPLSGLCHPIFVNGVLLGTLAIGRMSTLPAFTAGQVNIIHTFADFLGIQLRNSRIQAEFVQGQVLTRELEIAANIQRSLLPVRLPEPPGYHLAGFSRSASKVGGDFFDAITLEDGSLLLAIADVMGKGVPAALFAATFRSYLRARPDLGHRPELLLGWLNRRLHDDLDRVDMFVTAQLAHIDVVRRTVQVAAAGHCPLVYAGLTGPAIEVAPDGLPLGIGALTEYSCASFRLPPGARMLMLTDGIVEAREPGGQLLGYEPVKALLQRAGAAGQQSDSVQRELLAMVDTFRSGLEPHDDLTYLLVSELLPSGPRKLS
jgi:serine phosphatase RsbU (regulator of sigma subunit)/anti-sigma regulatory factor (Ser/Thr protein kinase)